MEREAHLTLDVLVEIEEDGDSFHASCPLFKGLHVDGATADEAFSRANDAAMVYLSSLIAEAASPRGF
jgi:predicted RNase H-like HicB family nuclease